MSFTPVDTIRNSVSLSLFVWPPPSSLNDGKSSLVARPPANELTSMTSRYSWTVYRLPSSPIAENCPTRVIGPFLLLELAARCQVCASGQHQSNHQCRARASWVFIACSRPSIGWPISANHFGPSFDDWFAKIGISTGLSSPPCARAANVRS